MSASDSTLDDVQFDELEGADQYEATFTGTLDGKTITLTYTLESVVGTDGAPLYTPGDEELEHVEVEPNSYEFDPETRETIRISGTDEAGRDLSLVYVLAEAEDDEANEVGITVGRTS